MLIITTKHDSERIILDVQGQLRGPWVRELEACWESSGGRPIRVLLCGVTFIDDTGKHLLAKMYQHGTELVAEGCMNNAIVREITGEKRGRRRKDDS